MEVTALCFRLLMLQIIQLGTQSQKNVSDAVFLRITPNRLQHFKYNSVSLNCDGTDDSIQFRGIRNSEKFTPVCQIKRTSTGPSCTFARAYPEDSGEYWCETDGERSNSINITVTDGSVILDSPVRPVMEGDDVTLRCRNKKNSTNLRADFYKDGVFIQSSPVAEMTINNVSKSDEGLYKCSISGVGKSPESWLAVRAASVILESPVHPVMEGDNVTLRCRNKKNSTNLRADFYKDGVFIQSSPVAEMTINNVSKSDRGLYRCSISDVGTSPESWLAVGDTAAPLMSVYRLIRLVVVGTPYLLSTIILGLIYRDKRRAHQLVAKDRSHDVVMEVE